MNAFSVDRAARTLVAAALLATTGTALAESNFVTGTGSPLTATAKIDFRITIPKVLFLQVGAGTAMADLGTVNRIDFAVSASSLGSGTPVAGTGGDLTGGAVTAKVLGNNGTITLSTSATSLSNGTDTIPYTQLSVTAATLTSTTPLAHPALNAAGTGSSSLVPNVGTKVTNLDAAWTYRFANAAIVPPGTYDGRMTYTASMP